MKETDDCDRDLQALFERAHRQLPPEPFVQNSVARLARERTRSKVLTRVLQAAVLAALVLGSHWLIAGSMLLSARIGALFALAAGWLSTPGGTAAALISLLALLVWRRRSLR